MDKPVIILGGGFWGGLLAWRLKEALPGIKFKLYAENSVLGNHQSCSFRSSDCSSSLKWLKPLITQTWDQHHIICSSFERWVTDPYHLIDSGHFHEVISKKIGDDLVLNNRINVELAIQSGSFVIDTRNICHYKKTAFRKWIALEVDLCEDHNLIAPVPFDNDVDQAEYSRHLYYLPVSSRRIILKDFTISSSGKIDVEGMRTRLFETMKEKGWKISKVIREDFGEGYFPLSSPVIRQEGRVINLASVFHDTTGCSIPAATRLIEKMVQTSFRLGELKEVVKSFRKEEETDRKFFRLLNSHLVESHDQKILEAVYFQPHNVIERFSRGRLNLLDRSRITLGRSAIKVTDLVNMSLPYSMYPKVQYPTHKSV